MAQTDNLLELIDSFPDAFTAVQSTAPTALHLAHTSNADLEDSSHEALDPQLRQLITEFPSAFVDPTPESLAKAEVAGTDSASTVQEMNEPLQASTGEHTTAIVNTQQSVVAESLTPWQSAQPGLYSQALKRQVSTMTWGQVELYLTYGDGGLQSLWVTVGKSGTEVQSLCEAIARLINLLLAQQVPILDIAKQIRGIRGADSEGLGPNRIMGLADLIGKVLQEAPTAVTSPSTAPAHEQTDTPSALMSSGNGNGHSPSDTTSTDKLQAEIWTTLTDHDHAASVCPECGAELHQVNGCSGGACVVCGYSSCS